MTRIYVRVRRDGRWDNVEVDRLTDAELDAYAADLPVEQARYWFKGLARWIRDNVREAAGGNE